MGRPSKLRVNPQVRLICDVTTEWETDLGWPGVHATGKAAASRRSPRCARCGDLAEMGRSMLRPYEEGIGADREIGVPGNPKRTVRSDCATSGEARGDGMQLQGSLRCSVIRFKVALRRKNILEQD